MKHFISALMLMVASVAAHAVNLPAPDILGVACGGYQSGSYVTIVGFDTNGNIQGHLHEIMSCSSGGRGGGTHRYVGDSNITWDFRGGYVTSWSAALAIPASGNVATDSYGNVVQVGGNSYTLASTLTINQLPPNPDYVEAQVPELVGLTDAQAQAALAAAGLTYAGATINYTYPAPAGEVFNQRPGVGALVPFSTPVALWETPAAGSGGGGSDD